MFLMFVCTDPGDLERDPRPVRRSAAHLNTRLTVLRGDETGRGGARLWPRRRDRACAPFMSRRASVDFVILFRNSYPCRSSVLLPCSAKNEGMSHETLQSACVVGDR